METLSAFHSLYLTDTHTNLLHLLHSPPPPPPSRNLAVLLARIPGTRLARCQIVTERSTASSSPVPPRVQTFFLPFFFSFSPPALSLFSFLICHPLHPSTLPVGALLGAISARWQPLLSGGTRVEPGGVQIPESQLPSLKIKINRPFCTLVWLFLTDEETITR